MKHFDPEITFMGREHLKIWRGQIQEWPFGMLTVIRSMHWSNQIALLLPGLVALSLMSCGVIDSRGGSGSPMMQVSLYKGSSPDKLKVKLENVSTVHLLVLMWGMPSLGGEIENDVFKVAKCSGENLPYQGRMVSRVGVAMGDVLYLRPGEKITRSIRLADYYELEKVDCYTVQYDSCFQYRAFKSEEQVSEFLRKFEKAPTLEGISMVECIRSNVLKCERGN